jgi:hypothetical protein
MQLIYADELEGDSKKGPPSGGMAAPALAKIPPAGGDPTSGEKI